MKWGRGKANGKEHISLMSHSCFWKCGSRHETCSGGFAGWLRSPPTNTVLGIRGCGNSSEKSVLKAQSSAPWCNSSKPPGGEPDSRWRSATSINVDHTSFWPLIWNTRHSQNSPLHDQNLWRAIQIDNQQLVALKKDVFKASQINTPDNMQYGSYLQEPQTNKRGSLHDPRDSCGRTAGCWRLGCRRLDWEAR